MNRTMNQAINIEPAAKRNVIANVRREEVSSQSSAAEAASMLSEKKKSSAPGIPKNSPHARRKQKNGDHEIRNKQRSDVNARGGEVDANNLSHSFYGGGMGMNVMSPYGYGYGNMGGMYGMGLGGMGLGGMYGMGMNGMGSQWLMSLNQLLFGVQSVVFSLGQAVQIVGMNAHQIRHVFESVRGMVENTLGHVNMKLLNSDNISTLENVGGEARRWLLLEDEQDEEGRNFCDTRNSSERRERSSQSDIIRRRRLAAFRWTLLLSVSYFTYKAIRKLVLRMMNYQKERGRSSRGLREHQLQRSGNFSYSREGGVSNNHHRYLGMHGGGTRDFESSRRFGDLGNSSYYG